MSRCDELTQSEGRLCRARGAAMQPQSQAPGCSPSSPAGLGWLVGAIGTGRVVTGGSLRSQETLLLKTLHRNT